MIKNKKGIWIPIGVILLVIVLWFYNLLQNWEYRTVDARFKIRGPIEASKDIVIVVADEDSIKHLGRWPWQRDVHARLIKLLTKYGAKSIVFDILFTEPDKDKPFADIELGKAAHVSGKVVVGMFFYVDDKGMPSDCLFPIEPILQNVKMGFVNIFTETDGVNRKIPLLMRYKDQDFPSLALAGLSVFLSQTPQEIITTRNIKLDEYYNEILINFVGGFKSFPYYSYYKVLNGEISGEVFKDKLVLIGGTATALFDFKAVPFAPIFPGTEIHANVMSNILKNNYLKQVSGFFTFIIIIIFALISIISLTDFGPVKGGLVSLSILFLYLVASYYLFKKNILIEIVAPLMSLILAYIGTAVYSYSIEQNEKKLIKKTFGHYLSPRILEKILSNPNALKPGGVKLVVTVLFSDIRNFTTITEALPAEDLVGQLNEYLDRMSKVIHKYDGTLDKYIGDAIMAYWNAPVPQDDHEKRAVLCGLDMINELKLLNEKWIKEGKKPWDIGIGINTGEVVNGNMGSDIKMDYTIIGDNVNLGSRLQSLNKEYGTKLLISEVTYKAVQDIVEAEKIGEVKVKGKTKPVLVYSILRLKDEKVN